MKDGLNLPFRLVKILDIGYVTTIYVILAVFLSSVIDELLGNFSQEEAKKEGNLIFTLKTIGIVWSAGTIVYFARNFVELIPSPFQGVAGFDHLRLKELTNASAFAFIFLLYQKHLRARLDYLYNMLIVREF
jgi:hypothetical protein